MSYKNFQKGINLRSTGVGLIIGFIFAFAFLLAPKPTHAESCFGNVDPAKYIESYLKTRQVETAIDINKLIAQTLNIKSGGTVSLGNTISVIVTSNKAILCFSNGDYSQGLKTLGEQATKIAIDKIAVIAGGYNLVTLPANIVELGIEIFRNAINKIALNNITENYMLAMTRCEQQGKSRDSCHNRIVECSTLSTAKEIHDPLICFYSDGYRFSNGWLIYPRATEQSFLNPEFLEKKLFYESAKAIYENKRNIDANEVVKQNEQVAAGLIESALKTLESNPETATAKNGGGSFFSNLWGKIVNLFAKDDKNTPLPAQKEETAIQSSDLSGQISNTIPENKTGKISTTQQPTNISKAIGITVRTYGQVDQRAYELAKTEAEKVISCLAPAIKERILSNNLTIVVIPSDSSIVDLPELSYLRGTRNKYGVLYDAFGGTFAGNLVVVKESEFIHHSGKILSDLGVGVGNVLRHELGHAIETLGFSDDERLELKLAYQEYKNKINPEIKREEEYFAERTQEYFEYIVPRYPVTEELLRRVYPCIAQELDRGKTVRAVIVDSLGMPLRNFPFSLGSTHPSNFEFQYKGVTDGNGAMEVKSLTPGRYTLFIQDPFPSQDMQSTGERLPYSSTKFDITDTDIDLGKIYQESFFGNNYPTTKESNIMIDGAITAAYLVSPVKFILSWDVPLEQRNNGCVLKYHDLKEEKQINIYDTDKLEISSSDNTMGMTYTYSLTCGGKKKEVTLYLRRM